VLGKGNRYLYQINKRCTNIVSIAVEGWSETEQQHEELGGCKYDEKDGEHTRKGTEGRHIWGLGCRE
jgi:hypothetical protein